MTEERVKRRLAAILAADVVGYSRLMGEDEAGTLTAMKAHHAELVEPAIAEHDGRIVKLMGDGTLAEFASVVDAVECAQQIQQGMAERNAEVPEDRRIEFRIGINLGDVIIEGDDIYGDGVNVAARLEALAEPRGICISGTVHDAIGNKLAVRFESIGEQRVKNIEQPVRAYRLLGLRGSPGIPPREAGRGAPAAPLQRGNPSLAIKPFENVSGDPDQDHFAEGLTTGIVVALTKMPRLALVGDESPAMYKSKQMTVQELGRRFDVRFVLKGGARQMGGRIRVTAELIEVSTGRYFWAERFDREYRGLGDLFDIQDDIVEEIVTALDVKLLSGEAARIVRKTFRNLEALESYYYGEQLLWRATTKLELQDAQRLFEDTIRLEPTCSVGYAIAAVAYWMEAFSGLSEKPSGILDRAVELARQALRLEDVTGYPHLVLAHVSLSRRQYDEAAAEADRAVSARPSCPASFSLKASVLNYLGRPAEAIEYAQYAVRLTPVHPPMYPAILATVYHGAKRHEQAIVAAKAAIQIDERNVDPYLVLAASNVALDHSEEARWAAQQVLALQSNFSLEDFAQSQPYKEQEDLDGLIAQLKDAGLV